MNSNPRILSTHVHRLPPILARDYRRNILWPIIAGLTAYTAAGAAFGYIGLIVIGAIR